MLLALEDLGLEMFHDQWARVKLWSMEESLTLEHLKTYQWETYLYKQEERLERRKNMLSNKRGRKIYEMRRAGCTYRVIGEAFDVTPARVREIFIQYERAIRARGDT